MIKTITKFFSKKKKMQELKEELDETDKDLIRLVDDLVRTLVKRGVIRESELPEAAIQKLDKRRLLRSKLTDTSTS